MNKLFVVFIVVAIAMGAALSGMLSGPINRNVVQNTAKPACVDYDPPSTTDTVTLNNEVYGLIKNNAQVAEDYKFHEMVKVGDVNGKGAYTMGVNYFGEMSNEDVLFVLQNVDIKAPYVFNVYLKNGVPMPDFIKNCKAIGGSLTIVEDDPDAFPPNSFNKTQIVPVPNNPTVAPAYVYDGNKTTSASLSNLSGATTIGSLFIASKNRNFSLTLHLGTIYLIDGIDAYEYLPTNDPINFTKESKTSLQLKKITFVQTPAYSWWTPACKPAIYLYPEKEQNVHVEVKTMGRFTLTIPEYPSSGWDVTAFPDGTIRSNGKNYPYLYYESEIPTSLVPVPSSGYVVEFSKLSSLFDKLLPDLSLNNKEAFEFSEYWLRVLPKSPYYFVGVMPEKDIDSIEPILINPKPKNVLRVRLYFEALDNNKSVPLPAIVKKQRDGFTVVEWGGMIKNKDNSNFTCGQ